MESSPDTEQQVYLRIPSKNFITGLPWQEVTSFGVNGDVLQLIGTVRRRDLVKYQSELSRAGAFIALLSKSISAEEVVRVAGAVSEKV